MKDIAAEAAYHLAVLLWFAASLALLTACFALLAASGPFVRSGRFLLRLRAAVADPLDGQGDLPSGVGSVRREVRRLGRACAGIARDMAALFGGDDDADR